MKVALTVFASAALAVASALPCAAQSDGAAQQQTPHEPGTGSSELTPASKAPQPVQAPDVRLDSKPHTDIDPTLDSSRPSQDRGLGARPEIDLGHDIMPTQPPGMVMRSEPGNPRMVYFTLPERSSEEMTEGDKTTLAARHGDLDHEAARKGFHLDDAGWSYRQEVCPSAQGGGSRFLLLQFKRPNGEPGFVAMVPGEANLPVWVTPAARYKPGKKGSVTALKKDKAAIRDAFPQETLYADLQPEASWIATSACLAGFSGATPNIPNEPYLDEAILTAPTPLLRLLRNGDRKVVFTNQVSDQQYSVWDEHVSPRGRFLDAQRQSVPIVALPVTNPPEPTSHIIAEVPQPPSHIRPEPPSPLSGQKQ